MASDLDRLIIDLQARLGEAEAIIKNLNSTVTNLNRFAGTVGGSGGAGAGGKVAVWKNSGELTSSLFLSETLTDVILTGGNFLPAIDATPTTGVTLGNGGGTPKRFKEIWTLDLQTDLLTDAGAGFITLGDTASLVPLTDLTITLGSDAPDLLRFENVLSQAYSYDATHGMMWGTSVPGPTGANLIADIGSEYLQLDGTPGGVLWVKESANGTSNGWQAALLDGANRQLSNLKITDPAGLDAHTSQVQINADLLPYPGRFVDIGSIAEAFHSEFISFIYPGTLGSYGTAAALPGFPFPINLVDSIKPAANLDLGLPASPFRHVYSKDFRFDTNVGLMHDTWNPNDPTVGNPYASGWGPGWLYVKDAGGAGTTLFVKETGSSSAVWTPFAGATSAPGSGTVSPGTSNHLSKYTPGTPPPPLTILEDSGVVEDGTAVRVFVNETEFHNSALDLYQLDFFGHEVPSTGNSEGSWRYEHRPSTAGGCLDPNNNTFGEFQAYLGPGAATPRIGIGDNAVTVSKANLAIWRRDSYAGPVLSVLNEAATIQKFTVNQVGDLRVIKELGYHWPGGSHPDLPVGVTAKVLGYQINPSTTLPTAGVAELTWVDMAAGGGVAGTGTSGALPFWSQASAPVFGTPSALLADSAYSYFPPSWNGATGTGTARVRSRQFLMEKEAGSPFPDIHEVYWRTASDSAVTGGQTSAIVRYERRPFSAGGCTDHFNDAGGEFNLFINSTSKSGWMGNHSWGVYSSFYIVPPGGYTDPVLVTRDPTTSADNFKVNWDGDLLKIKGLDYQWPTSTPAASTTTSRLLGYTDTATSGVRHLQWLDNSGVTGFANTQLSNLISSTAINQALIPFAIGGTGPTATVPPLDLGSSTSAWSTLWASTIRPVLISNFTGAFGQAWIDIGATIQPNSSSVSCGTGGNRWLTVGTRQISWDNITFDLFGNVAPNTGLGVSGGIGSTYRYQSGGPTNAFWSKTGPANTDWTALGAAGVGAGNISWDATKPKTLNSLPRWTSVGAAPYLIADSAISDDPTGPPPTVHVHDRLLQIESTTADFAEVLLQGSSLNWGKWSYRHGPLNNIVDGNNEAEGAMQYHAGTGFAGIRRAEIGRWSVSFTGGIYITPDSGYPNGALFELRKVPTGGPQVINFRIDPFGDMTIIKGQNYLWPTSSPSAANQVLTCTSATTKQLQWQLPTGGSGLLGSAPTTVNNLARFGPDSAHLTDSGIIDGGSGGYISVGSRVAFYPSTGMDCGASFSAWQNVWTTNLQAANIQNPVGGAVTMGDDLDANGHAFVMTTTAATGPGVKFPGTSTGIYGNGAGFGIAIGGQGRFETNNTGVFFWDGTSLRRITTTPTGTPLYAV